MTAAAAVMLKPVPTACPTCNGLLWDNRASKKNPSAPDFKCRDKSCEGVFWPPKPPRDKWVWADAAPAAAPARALPPSTPQPVSYGGPIAGLDEPLPQSNGAAPATTVVVPDRFAASLALYDRCLDAAIARCAKLNAAGFPVQATDVAAVTATLFIQSSR